MLFDLTDNPLISCVMPTYGRPDYVDEAVRMFLDQDYENKELIILNDLAIQEYYCDLPAVKVINTKTRFKTLGDKRNACIEAARGEIIAVWDDDDLYLPWRLSFSLNEMRKWKTPFYRANVFLAYWGEKKLHDNQAVPGWLNHPNTLFTKALWEQVGGYPAKGVGEDADFFAKIHAHLKRDFISYPINLSDRFFILRGRSKYHHMSISGGMGELNTSPGTFMINPKEIEDPLLRSHFMRRIATRGLVTPSESQLELPAISICIALKNRSRIHYQNQVLELFPKCINSIISAASGLSKVEVIVADFHSDDLPLATWLSAEISNVEFKVVEMDGNFSRGKGLNRAADFARAPILLFFDADMLIDHQSLKRAIDVVNSGNVWLPICQKLHRDGSFEEWFDFGVGVVAFCREDWEIAKPVPEFTSWGGEDNIFADRLQCHKRAIRERFEGIKHLWHPEECRHKYYVNKPQTDYLDFMKSVKSSS
jgi:glycosyltransferase involved in cell wall biosynthesis